MEKIEILDLLRNASINIKNVIDKLPNEGALGVYLVIAKTQVDTAIEELKTKKLIVLE